MDVNAALKYVNNRTKSLQNTLKDYAVSDFGTYKHYAKGSWLLANSSDLGLRKEDVKLTNDGYQKAYANYLSWKAKSTAQPEVYKVAGPGIDLTNSVDLGKRSFTYKPGQIDDEDPVLDKTWTKGNIPADKRGGEIKGVGQCAYFAQKAFDLITNVKRATDCPTVELVSNGVHNWVVVNREKLDTPDTEWVWVDYWYYACGAPLSVCVCKFADALLAFGRDFDVTDTHPKRTTTQ